MSAHTPGPWIAAARNDDSKGEPWVVFSGAYSDETVGICGSYNKHWPLTEHDARLIAAAPALLEALEALVKHNDALCAANGQFSTADAIGYQRNEKARAAIAQAKGESQ